MRTTLIEDKDKVKFITTLQEILDKAKDDTVEVHYSTIKDRYTALLIFRD